MKNLSENQLGIDNAVKELGEMISHISELISRVSEILSRVNEMTSGADDIKPTIFSLPDASVEMPRQARVTDEEPN